MAKHLKFKIWDPENKILVRSNKIDIISHQQNGLKILQFTGLKDQYGIEIFDEDVLMHKSRKYTVIWDEERAGWGMKDHNSILIIPLLPEKTSEIIRMYNANENH